jgi:hypothetical protein
MIYLTTPYSSKNPVIMEERFEKASEINARLMNQGLVVYSPIAHCHPLAMKYGLPTNWEFWKHFDEDLIARSEKLLVVKMEGWETSVGVQAEIQYARSIGKPIEFMEPL